jgi:hypothetical protein
MKQKFYQVVFPASLVVVMVMFLSIIFFADPNHSIAGSGNKKKSSGDRISAVEYTEAQIKRLQGTLNITVAQKELWNTLIFVMRENAKDMDAFSREKANNTKKMNSVERMKFHMQITEMHLDQQKKFIPPFEAFYASMSDQQKNITDIVFRTGKYGKH